jgi:hypothetical protein
MAPSREDMFITEVAFPTEFNGCITRHTFGQNYSNNAQGGFLQYTIGGVSYAFSPLSVPLRLFRAFPKMELPGDRITWPAVERVPIH